MGFFKTSILSGLATIIKMLSSLVVNKIIAIYIGSAGIALIGQFQSILSMVLMLGNGGINSGVTKYVAEYNKKKLKRDRLISAGLNITIVFSIIVGIIVFSLSNILSSEILKSDEYSMIFKVLALTLVLSSLNTFILSLLNGLKKIKLFIIVNIASSIFSLILTSILAIKYHLYGALLSTVIIQGIVLFIALPLVLKLPDFTFQYKICIQKAVYKKILAFSLMAIVTTLTVPVSQIVIRNYLIENYSIEQAGYWQAVWKVSDMYLMVLTTAFSTYYLPRLSELQTKQGLKNEILSGYKVIIPFVLVSAFLIYVFRDFIILVLYTPDFMEMRSLFLFQLVGSFFKMASFTLAYLMIAKAMTKAYIFTEVIFSISYYLLTVLFTTYYGLIGVTLAYAVNYFLYFILIMFIFRNIIFNTFEDKQY